MNLKNKIEKELQGIYKELDDELAKVSPGCDACGECCNFDKFDHVLYATMIEVDYIKRNVLVPQKHPSKNICPFLADQKCTIRDHRTLGCRVFYCNPDYQKNQSQEIYNKYYRKIKDLAQTHGLEWRYAPMLELLYQE
jgi:Fe-S-cluster containining protein